MSNTAATASEQRQVRLCRESRVDQINVAIFFTVIGGALLTVGAWVDYPGAALVALQTLLIVLGSLIGLVVLVRLLGASSLVWNRMFVVDPKWFADRARQDEHVKLAWRDCQAVGLAEDAGYPAGLSQRLVAVPTRDRPVMVHRMPVAAGVADALGALAPATWTRGTREPWRLLVTAPGTRPPDFVPATPTVVDLRTARVWQGYAGAAVSLFLGISSIASGVAKSHESVGMRIAFVVIGALFLLVGVAVAVSTPLLVRVNRIVLDEYGFIWQDAGYGTFQLGWHEIATVSVHITESHLSYPTRSPSTYAMRLVIELASGDIASAHEPMRRYLTEGGQVMMLLGDQHKRLNLLEQGVRRYCPRAWGGTVERSGYALR